MQALKPLFDTDADIVISHGNGPQIGTMLIQQAKADSPQTLPCRLMFVVP